MIRKLLLIGIPTLVLALLGFGLWIGGYKEIIPPPVLNYLWPSLVALAFLVYAVVALLLRGRKWLWPLSAGFLAQCLGGPYEPIGDDFKGSSLKVPEGAGEIHSLPEALPK